MIVVLNAVRSSHNVGSIFRTADGAGVRKIYLCGITPSPKDRYGRVNQRLVKVSLGTEKSVNFEKVESVQRLLSLLKRKGYKILALEQDNRSQNLFEFKAKKRVKYALLLGGEMKGLPGIVLKKADKILEIPMKGKKESLNVAVAFGIAIFYLNMGR